MCRRHRAAPRTSPPYSSAPAYRAGEMVLDRPGRAAQVPRREDKSASFMGANGEVRSGLALAAGLQAFRTTTTGSPREVQRRPPPCRCLPAGCDPGDRPRPLRLPPRGAARGRPLLRQLAAGQQHGRELQAGGQDAAVLPVRRQVRGRDDRTERLPRLHGPDRDRVPLRSDQDLGHRRPGEHAAFLGDRPERATAPAPPSGFRRHATCGSASGTISPASRTAISRSRSSRQRARSSSSG